MVVGGGGMTQLGAPSPPTGGYVGDDAGDDAAGGTLPSNWPVGRGGGCYIHSI